MFIGAWLPLQQLFRNRRFANLLELYELNYRRLRRLVPDLDRLSGDRCSRVHDVPDLYLHVLERHRFTVDLVLTHYFTEDEARVPSPDLGIRVYFDSGQAELLRMPAQLGDLMEDERRQASPLERRWFANLLLERWLHYCLGQGHRFAFDARDAERRDLAPLVEV
jgi:uncharacterized protein YqiB (DUF1249 family)